MLKYLFNLVISQSIPGCRFKDPNAISRMGCLQRNVESIQDESNNARSLAKLEQLSAKPVLI